MNELWAQWFHASLRKFFLDQAGSVTMHIEGERRATDGLTSWYEFRTGGVSIRPLTGNKYTVRIVVNILVVTAIDDSDVFRHTGYVGKVAAMFDNAVSIYKLGDVSEDARHDGSLLCCMHLDDEAIAVANFGQISATMDQEQSSVQATYDVTL